MMRLNTLRTALYHRLHFLVPLVPRRTICLLWHTLVWGFWLVYFSFILLVLALRYSVLPHIEDYHTRIEQLASKTLGQRISIGRIEASWEGINPDLSLLDVRIADAEGRPALAFSRVEAILSWWTVSTGQLKLRLLRIDNPTLNLRRDKNGQFFIAGIPLTQEDTDNPISSWILAQRRIRIRGATLIWEDDLRNAPPLVLEDLNFGLDNDGIRHRFGLTALPLGELASKIDVRGDFLGKSIEQFPVWSGKVFAEIDNTDLAVWRQWIDYPVAIPHGQGALRAWIDFTKGHLHEITADVSLQNLGLRFAQELPLLELDHLSGHIDTRFSGTGFVINGHRIELATQAMPTYKNKPQESIRVEPTDFSIEWQPEEGQSIHGSANTGHVDVGVLVKLAEYLPFNAHVRHLLTNSAPRGHITDLTAKWQGDANKLQTYSLQARFENLALKAQGRFPGFSGLSGQINFNEKSGSATLLSRTSTIDLPGVFPVPLIELDSLEAQARWRINQGEWETVLSHAEFSGKEAAGSAQGTYRSTSEGPGFIDMTAALKRGDARAVWRYMPHVVNEHARSWLKDSLIAGSSSEAKLKLKGNLADFPFLDKRKGQFLVTVKAQDVVLDYGKGWPRIEGIYGDLRFEGNGMTVKVHRGSILGAQLSNTRAEIHNFAAPIPTLLVNGKIAGATSEFLKFIEQSPVGNRIDHFTEDMRAKGNGHLDLNLVIPLNETRLDDSKIEGTYRFLNNEIVVDTALPPIQQVTGSVQFSGNTLRVPEINAMLLGGPLKISGETQKDGRVLITANGSVNIAQLHKPLSSPLLEHLSGTAPYHGEVHINKRNVDLVINSTLVGLSSSFPPPLNKTASAPLSFRFEKKLLSAAPKGGKIGKDDLALRDQISASLGDFLSMQVIRRKQKDEFVAERGAIAIGRPLHVPEHGISLGVSAHHVDLDAWRRLLRPADRNTPEDSVASPSSHLPNSISITAGDLVMFGRHYSDADLSASSAPDQWKIHLDSRQAKGDLLWEGAGNGKLTARLKQLTLEPSTASADTIASEPTEKLPALDIVADDFSLGERRFGRLEVQARNDRGVWNLNKIQTTLPYGNISGNGQWQLSGGKSRSQLTFQADSTDVGKFLERLGYPGTVRAGTAKLEGKISWNGAPTDLDYESLNGEMNLDARKGQFVKLDPGATGKLLGLISLQGLPRRISLDFKDVFSDGFSFDSMSSKLTIQNGVMRTDRLQIDGTSAHVLMQGEVDLKNETQRLNVNIQPEMGGTAALGAALVHPVAGVAAGVAAWVAHKVLQNPLNQIFSYDYLVTGKWDDPKVEKITGHTSPSGTPNEPSTK